jgi:hypothetical protein
VRGRGGCARARRARAAPGAQVSRREPSFATALSAFVWSASGNAFGGPDLFDGVRNLAVIEAAERSLTSRAAESPQWPASLERTAGGRHIPH